MNDEKKRTNPIVMIIAIIAIILFLLGMFHGAFIGG